MKLFSHTGTGKLSNWQMIVLMVVALQYGRAALIHTVLQNVTYGWFIALLIVTVLVLLLFWGITRISNLYPGQMPTEYLPKILGKPLATILMVLFALYFMLSAAFVLSEFVDTVKIFLLRKTPREVIVLAMLILSLYLVQGGVLALARVSELFFIFISIFTLSYVLLGIPLLRPNEWLAQVLVYDVGELSNSVLFGASGFIGFETLLFFAPFMEKPKNLWKSGALGIGIAMLMAFVITAVLIAVFTAPGVVRLLYPLMELSKIVRVPGMLLERLDVLFVVMRTMICFISAALYHYLAAHTLNRVVGLKDFRPMSCLFIIPIFLLTSMIPNVAWTSILNNVQSIVGYAMVGLLLLVVLPVALIRNRKKVVKADA